MKNDVIAGINAILQHMDEEEVKRVKDILKDLCSSPYSEMLIEVNNGQIVKVEYKKKKRYSMKKKENQ